MTGLLRAELLQCLAGACIFILLASTAATAQTTSSIVRPSLVCIESTFERQVRTADGGTRVEEDVERGTGFVISWAGDILTAKHLIQRDGWSLTGLAGHRNSCPNVPIPLFIKEIDYFQDAAVLGFAVTVENPPPPLIIGRSSELAAETEIMTVGFRGAEGNAPDNPVPSPKGIVVQPFAIVPDALTGMIEVNLQLLPGSSGSPLVTTDGKVVGMIVGGQRWVNGIPVDNITFAVPIDLIGLTTVAAIRQQQDLRTFNRLVAFGAVVAASSGQLPSLQSGFGDVALRPVEGTHYTVEIPSAPASYGLLLGAQHCFVRVIESGTRTATSFTVDVAIQNPPGCADPTPNSLAGMVAFWFMIVRTD